VGLDRDELRLLPFSSADHYPAWSAGRDRRSSLHGTAVAATALDVTRGAGEARSNCGDKQGEDNRRHEGQTHGVHLLIGWLALRLAIMPEKHRACPSLSKNFTPETGAGR